jgi:hypothetical protein
VIVVVVFVVAVSAGLDGSVGSDDCAHCDGFLA